MTPREELIGTVEHLPDESVRAILALVRAWQRQPVSKNVLSDLHEADEQKTVLARMGGESAYPLRGLPVVISEDFDDPMPEMWDALK
ncbi:MAG: hypothetical protein AAGM27_05030 [Cyanobacteria bacterium J06554_3]